MSGTEHGDTGGIPGSIPRRGEHGMLHARPRPEPQAPLPDDDDLAGSTDEISLDGTRCLLAPFDTQRGLSHTLLEYLSEQMPEIAFTMQEGGEVDAIWLCGYEPGSAGAVARLRASHPHALLLVTGRGDQASWEREVFAAGADHACAWPLPYGRLASLLTSRRERRAARSSSG